MATQKGDFEIEQRHFIASPRNLVFNYVDDYRNWDNFVAWKADDPAMTVQYGAHTAGKGARFSWTGTDGKANIKTLQSTQGQNIHQRMESDAMQADLNWNFKDTTGGTWVSWRMKGHMSFLYKVSNAFSGGGASKTESVMERSLATLEKSMRYELKTYNIKVDGVVQKTGTFYLGQRFTSKISNAPKNVRIVMPKLLYFFRKNNMKVYGKPFVIYHTYDKARGLTDMSVCVPVNEQIHLSAGSDLVSGKLNGFKAVKTTLTGDYSHLPEARDKASAYMTQKNIAADPAAPSVEYYNLHFEQEKHPSKWVTTVYTAVRVAAPAPVYVPRPRPVITAPSGTTPPAAQNTQAAD